MSEVKVCTKCGNPAVGTLAIRFHTPDTYPRQEEVATALTGSPICAGHTSDTPTDLVGVHRLVEMRRNALRLRMPIDPEKDEAVIVPFDDPQYLVWAGNNPIQA